MTTEYFSSFPLIINQDGQEIVDITYRIDFINRIKDNIALFQHINIVTGQRPEDIALLYYNDMTLYWVVLWLNNIVDPYYDWLLTDKELFTYVQNKYGADNVYATNHYETTSAHSLGAGVWVDSTNTPNGAISNLVYEQSLNEAKRQIKIVKPYYINQIIAEYEQELTQAAIEIMTGQLDSGLRTAGAPVIQTLILTTVMGENVNLIPQLDKLIVFEDIFSPVLRGELYLIDNAQYFDVLPISGNEKITICFFSYRYIDKDPLNYINRTCDILKIENVTQINDYTKRYKLVFASPELKKSETVKISKGYQNKRISEIVADLMTQDYDSSEQNPDGLAFPTVTNNSPQIWSTFLGSGDVEVAYQKIDEFDSVELFIEKTKYSDTLGLPYMKPFDAINWLSTRAIRNNGGLYGSTSVGSANFLFFENKRGFQFVTLDSLIEQKTSFQTLPKFVSGLASANLPAVSGAGIEGRNVNFYSITNLKIEDCYDIINNIRSGLYASQYLTYDITTGEVNENIWDYMEQYPKMETVDRGMGEGPFKQDFPLISQDASGKNPLTQKPYSKRIFTILGNREYDPITSEETARFSPVLQNVGPEQYLQQRIASIARFAQFRISLEIPANSRHKVGDMIDFQIDYWTYGQLQSVPTATASLFTSAPHKYYSGAYLITAIKHILTGMDYIMQIEIVKDSTISQIGPVPDSVNGPSTTP